MQRQFSSEKKIKIKGWKGNTRILMIKKITIIINRAKLSEEKGLKGR